MKQWDRQYRFAAGKVGSEGFEIGEQNQMTLHINFNVQKQDASTANTSKITIWNLNAPHLMALNEPDCIVSLKAGYGTAMPLIFTGAVTHIETSNDDSDVMTVIEAVDGRVALRDTFVSLSYKGKINTKKIIESVFDAMGIPCTFSHNAKFTDLPNGYSFIGAGKIALDKACIPTNLIWEIQRNLTSKAERRHYVAGSICYLTRQRTYRHTEETC
ncbi:hypothetical protein FACS1894105_09750 [Clostridia bacterium]|nr:hypothetical protein FACS1894105_09750 [Clostridia bacterium]